MLKLGTKNLIYANAENLPFPDKSFNTVISVTAFHNFKNMEKALKEIIRVSKNNNIAKKFLKISKKLAYFRKLLKKYFKNFIEIDSEKDIIFLIHQQQSKF
jgi:ubiquinone/menaquinone biosynthesis C-methylase UbiE